MFAFSTKLHGSWEILVARADGSDVHQATTGSILNVWPSWSPDGSAIVFERVRGLGQPALCILRLADGTVDRVTNARDGTAGEPDWFHPG
jgi:Tol biopolymer transport system component